MYMKYLYIFLIAFFLVSPYARAEEMNAGFVEGIWYSSTDIVENVPIRVFAALRNNTDRELTGTVRFMDNETRIGSQEVHALPGRIIEAWVDWTPSTGSHTITATLHNTLFQIIKEGQQPSPLGDASLEKIVVVDSDTDKDKIGDKKDADDDGDQISDEDEKRNGTDPRIPEQKEISNTGSTTSIATTTPATTPTAEPTPEAPLPRNGLERYLDDGIAATFLKTITEQSEATKQSLDTYRHARNEKLTHTEALPQGENPDTMTTLGTYTDTATITKSTIETKKQSLWSTILAGARSIIENVWTFILFILSKSLSSPALVQVILLILILVFFFKLARRIGSRPN